VQTRAERGGKTNGKKQRREGGGTGDREKKVNSQFFKSLKEKHVEERKTQSENPSEEKRKVGKAE